MRSSFQLFVANSQPSLMPVGKRGMRRGYSLGWARPSGNTVLPVECLWRCRVAVVFLILKWRRLHSKNSAWLSDSSTCMTWNQSKFIDNWVRHAVMALWAWKMCVRGCDSSKKGERLVKTTRPRTSRSEDEPLKKRLLQPCNRGVSVVKNVYVYRVITLRNDCIFSFLWWVVFK